MFMLCPFLLNSFLSSKTFFLPPGLPRGPPSPSLAGLRPARSGEGGPRGRPGGKKKVLEERKEFKRKGHSINIKEESGSNLFKVQGFFYLSCVLSATKPPAGPIFSLCFFSVPSFFLGCPSFCACLFCTCFLWICSFLFTRTSPRRASDSERA